jgi:cell division protein FtsL
MLNRLLLATTLGLVFFQIFFSVYYSSQMVNSNQKYSDLEKKYSDLKYINENLQIEFAHQYAINGK